MRGLTPFSSLIVRTSLPSFFFFFQEGEKVTWCGNSKREHIPRRNFIFLLHVLPRELNEVVRMLLYREDCTKNKEQL